MEEIVYYDWTNPGGVSSDAVVGGSDTRYNMATNTGKINKFKISFKNEIVSFSYHQSTNIGVYVDFCSQDMDTLEEWDLGEEALTSEQNYPKPIHTGCQNLYPCVYIGQMLGGNAVFGSIIIEKCGLRINGQVFGDSAGDWWSRNQNKGTQSLCLINEQYEPYQNDDGTNPDAYENHIKFNGIVVGDNPFDKFVPNIILEENSHYIPSNGANMRQELGFIQDVLHYTTTQTGVIVSYISTKQPDLSKDVSLFVRLNNFTHQSFNGGTARPSKILYTMPRFDNSGRENGNGLYFAPPQMIYLPLGNTDTLYINDFDISLTNDKEVLSKTLQGQTILTLDIKPV
jgi:hypothetical protein